MQRILFFITIILSSLTTFSQCDSVHRPWYYNASMLAPTIYVIEVLKPNEIEQVYSLYPNTNIGNRGQSEIVMVGPDYINKLIADKKQKGQFGKQYFVIVSTLLEAIKLNLSCDPMPWYVIE